MRLYALSDIHCDYAENLEWIRSISDEHRARDVCLLAGDVSHDLAVLRQCLELLTSKFARVFFCPGNHDLWVRSADSVADSYAKLEQILQICHELGVETRPARVTAEVVVVPLHCWYHDAMHADDGPPDNAGGNSPLVGWMDFYNFRAAPRPPPQKGRQAPIDLGEKLAEAAAIDERFLGRNAPLLAAGGLVESLCAEASDGGRRRAMVVSFSHFVPRLDLLPPRERLMFKELGRVSVSAGLDAQIRQIGSSLHVFGHTHINCDKTRDSVRYVRGKAFIVRASLTACPNTLYLRSQVQHPLKYPKERSMWQAMGREWFGVAAGSLAYPLYTSTAEMVPAPPEGDRGAAAGELEGGQCNVEWRQPQAGAPSTFAGLRLGAGDELEDVPSGF